MRYGPANGRDGNAGHLVKGGDGTVASPDVTTDDLIHHAQLVERTVASVLLGQLLEQISREFDNGLSGYIVWLIQQLMLSVPRNSQW